MEKSRSNRDIRRKRYGSFRGGRTEAFVVTPRAETSPRHEAIVFLSGFGGNGTVKDYSPYTTAAVRLSQASGQRVDYVVHNGRMPTHRLSSSASERYPDDPKKTKIRTGETPRLIVNRVDGLMQHADAEQLDKVVIVAHSHGSHTALEAATRHPDRIRGVIAVAPAALTKEQPIKHLIPRFTRQSVQERIEAFHKRENVAPLTRLSLAGLAVAAAHPLRVLTEVSIIKYTNMGDVADSLNYDTEGVSRLGVVFGAQDTLFGGESVRLDSQAKAGHSMSPGAHNEIIMNELFMEQSVVPLLQRLFPSTIA